MLVPAHPVDIPANSYFIWPLNMDLDGVRLRYSTAQPFCRIASGRTVMYVFFALPGIPAEFSFVSQSTSSITASSGKRSISSNEVLVSDIEPSLHAVIEHELQDGRKLKIVVLTQDQAKQSTRVKLPDGDHLVLTTQQVFSNGRLLTLRALDKPIFNFSVWPALSSIRGAEPHVDTLKDEGIFKSYRATGVAQKVSAIWTPERFSAADFFSKTDAITVPTEAEFKEAPNWKITLSKDAFRGVDDLFLKVDYQGDIARLNTADRLLTDDFYKGTPWCIGLKRFRQQVEADRLNITIFPWRDRSKVVLDSFATKTIQEDGASIIGVTVSPEYQLTVR
jgi:hypothetical protein